MRVKVLAMAAAASLVLFAWASIAGAGDTFRLGGTDAATMTLGLSGEADTVLVRGRAGFSSRGFYRGGSFRHSYGGHWRSGFYRGGYYRPYWGGYWRPRFYGSFYYPGYWYPGYFGFGLTIGRPYAYYPPIYSAPAYYPPACDTVPYPSYAPAGDYGSATLSTAAPLSTTLLRSRNRVYMLQPPREMLPAPRPVPADGSYRYDGDPMNPVPLPGPAVEPMTQPPAKRQIEGRVASMMPVKVRNFAYPAYGERQAGDSLAAGRLIPVKADLTPRSAR